MTISGPAYGAFTTMDQKCSLAGAQPFNVSLYSSTGALTNQDLVPVAAVASNQTLVITEVSISNNGAAALFTFNSNNGSVNTAVGYIYSNTGVQTKEEPGKYSGGTTSPLMVCLPGEGLRFTTDASTKFSINLTVYAI